jgi:hypothetical protein
VRAALIALRGAPADAKLSLPRTLLVRLRVPSALRALVGQPTAESQRAAPAAATTLVAEWHQVQNGKLVRAQSAFDGRPFAAMFAGAKK